MKKSFNRIGYLIAGLVAGVSSPSSSDTDVKGALVDGAKNNLLDKFNFAYLNDKLPDFLAAHRSHSSHSSHRSHQSHRSSSGGYSYPSPSPSPSPSPRHEPLGQPSKPISAIPAATPADARLESVMSDADKRRNIIMRVQLVLESLGLYKGAIDGQMGPQTRAALNRYRGARGLAASEKLDVMTLNSLGVAVQ